MTQDQLEQLEDCLESDHGLHGKELDFIVDLDENWRSEKLTERQADWLERIADRIREQ